MSRQKETQKKGMPIYKIIILIALILIVLMLGYIALNKNKTNNTQTAKGGDTTTPQQSEETAEVSLIDMNNTENAKIEEGVKENTSKKLLEDKKYKGMTIKNIQLKAEGGISKLTATVQNETKEDYSGEKVNIIFINQDGSEYARLEAVLPAVDSQKQNEIDAGTTADIANAYDFKIESAE